jgi:Lrp/AsnC family transcriptional regulator for asnA, asnC and gidA
LLEITGIRKTQLGIKVNIASSPNMERFKSRYIHFMSTEGERINQTVDDIDAKIIKDLLVDARKSFVEIASECNLSTAAISDRFAQLQKAGIIVGSTIRLNHKTMGHGALCNVLVNVHHREIEQVVEFIKKLPFNTSLVAPGPKNSIGLVAGFSDIREVTKFKESVKRHKSVTDVKVEVWTDIKNMPERIQLTDQNTEKEEPVAFSTDSQKNDYILDEIDRKLIEKLLSDSMQPFGKIAKEIGTSINTVSRKYKRLVENGVIKPTIQLNLPKLGYTALVCFPITFASESDPNDVMKEILAIKNSFLLIKTSGEVDLFAYVMLRDLNQLLEAQSRVARMGGISRMEMKIFPVLVPWPAVGEYISTF